MEFDQISEIFDKHFDENFLVETLSELAKIPTEVPLGYNTFMDPEHPKLIHYVQEVMKPKIKELKISDIIDTPLNNIFISLGAGTSENCLLIQNYTVTQHHNLMENPFSGKIESGQEFGVDEPVIFGQGVSQNKSHQAVMLAILKLIQESGLHLNGRLYWTINNEGNSSHECTKVILNELPTKPTFGILQINTGLKLWLGNRGRVDINVHVKGKATHSSSPELGNSAIEGVNEVINRLKSLSWNDDHPLLGGRHAIVYKIKYEPVAPHTLPSDAFLAIDRRLIPGDDVDEAVKEVHDLLMNIDSYEVTVEKGHTMVPAMVNFDLKEVKAIQQAFYETVGTEMKIVYGGGAFDAGGLCEESIPTVMFGSAGGDGLLGTDFIPISEVMKEARVLFNVICKLLL